MSTVIGFRFPAGRYHATPWETHVNEAAVEWPPSPWRILRALISVWHRKINTPDFTDEQLGDLVDALASEMPLYRLPRSTHAHSRHYMPVRKGKGEAPTLVFDAFMSVAPSAQLLVVWPHLELDAGARTRLALLLDRLGYLGRAESWVEARLLEEWDGTFDCAPLSGAESQQDVEHIRLPGPLPPPGYIEWRGTTVSQLGLDNPRPNKTQQRQLATLPERLVDALRLESEDVRKEGWSRWPGLEFVTYSRPSECVGLSRISPRRFRGAKKKVTTARLILSGRPLPQIEDAVRIGELVRLAAISSAGRQSKVEGDIPSVLSGHAMGAHNRHEHAFYLPEDANNDGRIDHIVVHTEQGFDSQALAALGQIRRIWRDQGREWHITIESYGSPDDFIDQKYMTMSKVWVSVTPYLYPWYRKKGFDTADQILRECRERGLPVLVAEPIETIIVHGRERRPVHFHRFRGKRGLRQPDTRGSFWRLTFAEPCRGPIALGFGCHFGLGVFQAVSE